MASHFSHASRRVAGVVAIAVVAAACAQDRAAFDYTKSFAGATIEVVGDVGVGLVDTATGQWHLLTSEGTDSFFFGNPGDFPFAGDWDCDGVDTPGLYRQSDGFVYLRNSNTTGNADVEFFFGDPGDVPIAGDFNGDGCDTVSIYRPSIGRFFIIDELGEDGGGLGAAETDYLFGNVGDKPFVGDFDGDGIATVGLHRESTGLVYFRNSHSQGNAHNQFIFGDPDDRLVAGDWNEDGNWSPGLFRPSSSTFFLRYQNTQGNANESFPMGDGDWLPVAGVWESGGDRTVDFAFSGPGPEELRAAIESVYLNLDDAPGIPEGLVEHLASVPKVAGSLSLSGDLVLGTVGGTDVAVVTSADDVLLAVEDPEWRIVGAKLERFGSPAWYGNDPHRVAVIGTDARDGEEIEELRADAPHILIANAATGAGTILNFSRYTHGIADYGVDTFAHSMVRDPEWDHDGDPGTPPVDLGPRPKPAWGAAHTTATMERTTGLELEGYVVTGMPEFEDLVDDMISVFGTFLATLPWTENEFPPGSGEIGDEDPETLTGETALTWARERVSLVPGGEINRVVGHGVLIEAALHLMRQGDVGDLPLWLAVLEGYVATDLSVEQLLQLGATAFELATGTQVGPGADPFDPELSNVVLVGCLAEASTELSPWTLARPTFWTIWDDGEVYPEIAEALMDAADGYLAQPPGNATPFAIPEIRPPCPPGPVPVVPPS